MPRAPPRPGGVPQSDPSAPVTGCGIHSIALSPDRRLLATGGANPCDCQILAVRDGGAADAAPGAPQLAPVQTLVVRGPVDREQLLCTSCEEHPESDKSLKCPVNQSWANIFVCGIL